MDEKKKIKILIIDDEERLLRVLRLGLKPLGYDVRTASDGEEGFEELLSQTYDIVLTDVRMPRLNGVDLVYELERLNIDVPLIVMTAHAEVDSAVKSLKHGALDYIRKPFTVEELHRVLSHVIATHTIKRDETLPSLEEGISQREKELIQKSLVKSGNNKTQAARLLRISERTLWYKLKKYNLN